MATGILEVTADGVLVRLLENLAAGQGAPPDGAPGDVLQENPTSTQFFDFKYLKAAWRGQFGLDFEWPDYATAWLYETAGSGTITLSYARLWLFQSKSGKAFPAGIGTDAAKGYLNGGSSFGETGTEKLRHCEPLVYPGSGDGINVELGTVGGTSPTFNFDLFFPAPTLASRQAEEATLETMRRVLERLDRLPRDYTI